MRHHYSNSVRPKHDLRDPVRPNTIAQACSGFSLVELAVVIAVLAILATLLLPVRQQSKKMATRSACIGNFRQIGTATHLFARDNNDYLPNNPGAGLALGQIPGYDGVDFKPYLLKYLYPYLGGAVLSAPETNIIIVPCFICPATILSNPGFSNDILSTVSYFLIRAGATNSAGGRLMFEPFGNANSGPVKLSNMTEAVWGGIKPYMLSDADANRCYSGVNAWPGYNISLDPPHDDRRNHLFFDGHAESRHITHDGLTGCF